MSYNVSPIDITNEKPGFMQRLKSFLYKINGALELALILFLWIVMFNSHELLGDFTRAEIITYIIFGNLMSILVGYLLQGVLHGNIDQKSNELLLKHPIIYLFKIFFRGFGRNFLAFVFLGILNLVVLYFFIDSFIFNYDKLYLIVIGVMLALAFVSEFLMAYLARMFIFWSWENKDSYIILTRLKRLLAGNYLPLSMLPVSFFNISLTLPFAYAFYVPAELYLKKLDLAFGIQGLSVQVVWIFMLYGLIRLMFWREEKKQKLKKQKTAF